MKKRGEFLLPQNLKATPLTNLKLLLVILESGLVTLVILKPRASLPPKVAFIGVEALGLKIFINVIISIHPQIFGLLGRHGVILKP